MTTIPKAEGKANKEGTYKLKEREFHKAKILRRVHGIHS